MHILDVLKERGFIAQTTFEDELYKQLEEPTTFYVGFDPTADSLHIGHYIPIMAMAHMQRAGHRPIALMGGGTAMIGDPSGKTDMRKMMTVETIDHNVECIKQQMSRFLDFSGDKAIIVNNADWLRNLNFIEFMRDIGAMFSVNKMLTADCYKTRMATDNGLSFLEFTYMLMQSYDFLELFHRYGCRLEMGGNDQWSNMLGGADLVRRKDSEKAFACTFQLLLTHDGKKMGKTEKGALWLDPNKTSPFDFYQYWRNVDDADVEKCLGLLTFLPMDEVRRLGALQGSEINEAKKVLAFEVTKLVHGEEEAQKAADAAWDVIQMNKYSLIEDKSIVANGTTITDEDAKFLNAMKSYELVWQNDGTWSSETIWGWWWRTSNKYSNATTGYDYMGGVGGTMIPALPPNFGFYAGFGGTAPSLKLADSYPMWSTGRYPVKGYEGRNDMSKPIVDPLSGYKTDGFTEGYKQYVDPLYPEWRPAIKAHNTCIDRDPRFYATMVPNGFYWPHQGKNKLFTCFNSTSATSPWSASSNCIRVGYAFRRAYPAGLWFDTSTEYTPVTSLKWVYPAFRMAEIYLNYAEACNEKPERDAASAIEYLNKVRNRAGLNNIEEAYPGIENDKELLRWCIHKERGVEFAFEAHRHYDACRWMEAKEEYPGPWYSLHCSATTYEESYQRVTGEIAIEDNVFRDKDYLCPIYSGTLAEMVNMTQNLGH